MNGIGLKKQRIEYFDLLKGIAIFMVVMGHALTMCVRGLDAAFLFKLIGQVHMPVFFFISGYLTYKANTDSITLTGGCAKNEGLKKAIEKVLKIKVVNLKTDPQLMGALGAAEYARQKGMA